MAKQKNWLLGSLALAASSALMLTSSLVYAQQELESEEVTADTTELLALDTEVMEEVVVTGSRLKRSTFSSLAPLQIISAGISREAGLINAADILQSSTSAGGQQVDLTFSGFVLDNGPASRNLSLRGLGASRSLILVNGRRLAPGGAEGAPYAPDIGAVPAGLVQRYEILTDGASSVYGSDAIGGVANIILKNDFDGFTLEGGTDAPKYDGGENVNLNLTWGKNWDRGFIGAGLDYNKSKSATYGSRPWMAECEKNYEVDTDGNFRSADLYYSETYGMRQSDCVPSSLARRVFVPGTATGSIYYTPGQSNGGWANFSEPVSPYGNFGIDANGDGITDASYADYSLNGTDYGQSGHLVPDYDTATAMAYGEYTFDGDANVTAYFETLYTEVGYEQLGSPSQLFPDVPANNPYNLCNPDAENGVDCGLAEDALLTNPGYVAQFSDFYTQLANCYGLSPADCSPAAFGLLNGPIGAIGTLPIVSVKNDRSASDGSREQLRFVAGLKGDMPFMEMGTLTNWSFDSYISYSKSSGASHRYGIRGDRLDLSLGNYSSTDTPCENDSGVALADDAAPGCVAVNMYAPSLYPDDIVGEFATQAETDYLFDSRDFDTDYEQTVFSASMVGDLYELANGPVLGIIGVEYRKDEINSMPDAVARDGLFFGYFSDGGAVGSKDMTEVFFEVEAPLLANAPMAKELTLNLSARLTDDEIYGSNTTESVKIGWRPVNSLLIRGTYGTAFRAPNLRELFLANQTGFTNIGDPCMAPEEAIDQFTGEYNGANDPREALVLANCSANGVDPTVATGFGSYSVEQLSGGSLTLLPETSTSWTAGFSWEQEFSNEFDLGISSTYYEVDINDTIIEPSGQYIVNDCYGSPNGLSTFCDRISRDFSDPTSPNISFIDNGFLNRDNENARGVDVNVTFADTWTIAERPYEVSWDIKANRSIERSFLFVNDEGEEDYDDLAEEWGFPSWKGESQMRVEYDKWRIQLRSNFIAAVQQDVEDIDEFSDIFGTSDTCLGAPDDLQCRDVGFAKDYMIHTLSVSYIEDNWAVTLGARNVFDKAPPRVDGTEITSVNNAAIGYGYNMMGRTIYLNGAYEF